MAKELRKPVLDDLGTLHSVANESSPHPSGILRLMTDAHDLLQDPYIEFGSANMQLVSEAVTMWARAKYTCYV